MCCSSKSHKLPFKVSLHKSSKPLELIPSYVWGPALEISHFIFKYYVIFVDDFTKYTWFFASSWLSPLKNKSDVLRIFMEFHPKAERQFLTKLISLQTDWGGELHALQSYLKQHGISHRVSCPYTPEQNGSAKRKHRHLIETTFSLLKTTSLPAKFWDEAVCTCAYLINGMTTPLLRHKSPYELLYKEFPDYHFLRTFGCLCYPHLRAYMKNKLDSRFEKCVFLGYCHMHLGYRCLLLITSKLYISRDVIFKENVFPFSNSVLFSTPPSTESQGILGQGPVIIAPSQSLSEFVPLASSFLNNSTSSPPYVATTILPKDPKFLGTKNQEGTLDSHSSPNLTSS